MIPVGAAIAIDSSRRSLGVVFILTAAAAICGCCNEAHSFVNGNGWSLPPRRLRHDGGSSARFRQTSLATNDSPLLHSTERRSRLANDGRKSRTTRRPSYLTKILHARGGAADDEVECEAHEDVGEHGSVVGSGSGDEESADDGAGDADGENDMRELRKKWSSVPAVPSVALPFADGAPGDDPAANTLADFDDENPGNDPEHEPTKAIIIMDGFSPYHGQYLSHAARDVYGSAVIHVLSDFFARYLYQVEGRTDHLASRMPDLEKEEDVEAWSSMLPPSLEICGIYCESESGLEDAERLGVALGLYPRYHDGVNNARRNKFLMNQAASEVGLDVVKQRSCRTLEEVEEFARDLGLAEGNEGAGGASPLVVVKPLRGVASDDVHLCPNLPSVRAAFSKILGSSVFGSSVAARHERVLAQEFAAGVEYAADVVCRDGERKVAALWRYDKRAVNGAPFVYHKAELVPADGGGAEGEACAYVLDALDALGVRWGLSHVEVIVGMSPETGERRVRLVEVNCRQHNMDFAPLCDACVGYNAMDVVLAAHLGGDGGGGGGRGLPWDSVPALPSTRAHGAVVHFVSHVRGTISRIRYDVLAEMESLASVRDMLVYPRFMEPGNPIRKTVDIRSDSGWAHVMNNDEEEFQRDYARLVELQKDMFEVEEEEED